MLLEGCQGKKGVQIQEKVCPNCGNMVELMSCDACVVCEKCGFPVYSDLVDCVQHCTKAKECVGEAQFARLTEARRQREEWLKGQNEDDEW